MTDFQIITLKGLVAHLLPGDVTNNMLMLWPVYIS